MEKFKIRKIWHTEDNPDEVEAIMIPQSANVATKVADAIREKRNEIRKKFDDDDFELNYEKIKERAKVMKKETIIETLINSKLFEIRQESKDLVLIDENDEEYNKNLDEKVEEVKKIRKEDYKKKKVDELRKLLEGVIAEGIENAYILKPFYEVVLYNCVRRADKPKNKVFDSPNSIGDDIDAKTFDGLIDKYTSFNKGRTEAEAKK